MIPLDVVKTKMQAEPDRYSEGLVEGAFAVTKEEGFLTLLAGWEPTLLGYLWYGVTVYPGYEFFKRLYLSLVPAEELRVLLVLLAGATATVFACFGVCPAEACRIRMVTDPAMKNLSLIQAASQLCFSPGFASHASFPWHAFYVGKLVRLKILASVLCGTRAFATARGWHSGRVENIGRRTRRRRGGAARSKSMSRVKHQQERSF